MQEETATIVSRLTDFLEKKYGHFSQRGNKTKAANALGMSINGLNAYLSGNRNVGGIVQQKLRDIGADIEWIMTGKSSGSQSAVSPEPQEADSETQSLKQEVVKLKAENETLWKMIDKLQGKHCEDISDKKNKDVTEPYIERLGISLNELENKLKGKITRERLMQMFFSSPKTLEEHDKCLPTVNEGRLLAKALGWTEQRLVERLLD